MEHEASTQTETDRWELEKNKARFQIKWSLFSELDLALSVERPNKSSWLFQMIHLHFLLVTTKSNLIGNKLLIKTQTALLSPLYLL